jgi:hypothetical protein
VHSFSNSWSAMPVRGRLRGIAVPARRGPCASDDGAVVGSPFNCKTVDRSAVDVDGPAANSCAHHSTTSGDLVPTTSAINIPAPNSAADAGTVDSGAARHAFGNLAFFYAALDRSADHQAANHCSP